jgi:hypothetical protein
MDNLRLRDPREVPLYVFSVLVNLSIVALILVGALLLGFFNALAGDPLSGPVVGTIRVAFVALLLLVPGLVVYRQLTRAGIRGSAVRLSQRQFPDIHAVKEDFARRLALRRDPEIYLMSGNGTLNAFAASTFGYDFVVIHSELFSNTYEKNKAARRWLSSSGTSWGTCGSGTRGSGTSFRPPTWIGFLCSGRSSREPGSSPATGTARTWRRGARKDWCCLPPDGTSTKKWTSMSSWSRRGGSGGSGRPWPSFPNRIHSRCVA